MHSDRVIVTARLPANLREALMAIAKRRGESLSDTLQRAVEYYLQHEREARVVELRDELTALEACIADRKKGA